MVHSQIHVVDLFMTPLIAYRGDAFEQTIVIHIPQLRHRTVCYRFAQRLTGTSDASGFIDRPVGDGFADQTSDVGDVPPVSDPDKIPPRRKIRLIVRYGHRPSIMRDTIPDWNQDLPVDFVPDHLNHRTRGPSAPNPVRPSPPPCSEDPHRT